MKIKPSTFFLKTTIKALKGFINYKLGRPNPLFAQWEITYRCNFKCRYCNIWRNKDNKQDELTLEEIKSVIDQLDKIGVIWITFTGGEPLLKKELPEILNYCAKKGIITLVNDNGSLLKQKLPELEDVLNSISISIDSPNEEINDKIRGVKGAFKTALSAAVKSKDLIRTIINMTVTAESLNSIDEMTVLCKNNGLKVMFTPVSIIPNEGYEKSEANSVLVNPQIFYKKVFDLKKKYGNIVLFKPYMDLVKAGGISKENFICKAAKLMINLKPNGDIVYPCGYFPIKKYSVKKKSLTEIIKQGRLLSDKYFDFCKHCTLSCFLTPSLAISNIRELINLAKTF